MGVPTGLDFNALMALRGRIGGWIQGEALHGAIWRAGLPRTLQATA
jgi:hydroxymethylglutaryl-CoA lyase